MEFIMFQVKPVWMRATLFFAAVVMPALPGAGTPPAVARKAVVVELFTSEGCSSCPPADALLGRLREEKFADGLEVVPLGLHVDYWNFQGWTDRFSSAAYSRRQEKYAERFHIEGPYTPQMVVDGAWQFTGGDALRARQAILQAAQHPQLAQIDISFPGVDKLLVKVKAEAGNAGEVMMAVTEDNLSTKVRAGENDGRELRHAAVVRELRSLGRLHDGTFEAGVPLKFPKDWKREDLRLVVFVQDPATWSIAGAATVPLAAR
jgi:hypothetical protein